MTAIPNIAPGVHEGAEAAGPAAAPNTGPFVLNLCSSTTPMALAQTDLPELKRFTFFVSRRFEEGRERFRLHMGYFATLAEAEEWLAVVREIYPGAWAGEAPGRKLRERAAAAAAAQVQHAAGPQPRVALPVARAAAPPPVQPAPAAASAPPVFRNVPVVQPASPPPPVARAAPVMPAPAPKPPAPDITRAPVARAAAPRTTPSPPQPAPTPPPVVANKPKVQPDPRAAAAPTRAAPAPGRKGVFEDSNVREVLAALGDSSATGETRLMRAPPPRPTPPPPVSGALSDTQVLKLLETRAPEGGQPAADVSGGSIPFLKPDDTATRRALQEAVANNAPVAFAVQLQWSVQPADLLKVPPLAIFSAYTLYTVEGSRDGRKWYGLRLGFFSDAISAKQVAHYVRSEFTSVAVVPVSPEERVRATEQDKKAAMVATPGAARAEASDEFKLLDDDGSRVTLPSGPPPAVAPAGRRAAAKPAAKTPPAKPQPKVAVGRTVRQSEAAATVRGKSGGKVGARERRGAQTLEETLEILGASALTIDNGNGETLNDTGVRHLRIEQQNNSPFARLLERLSERVKKP
jgi:hypothetical protein